MGYNNKLLQYFQSSAVYRRAYILLPPRRNELIQGSRLEHIPGQYMSTCIAKKKQRPKSHRDNQRPCELVLQQQHCSEDGISCAEAAHRLRLPSRGRRRRGRCLPRGRAASAGWQRRAPPARRPRSRRRSSSPPVQQRTTSPSPRPRSARCGGEPGPRLPPRLHGGLDALDTAPIG